MNTDILKNTVVENMHKGTLSAGSRVKVKTTSGLEIEGVLSDVTGWATFPNLATASIKGFDGVLYTFNVTEIESIQVVKTYIKVQPKGDFQPMVISIEDLRSDIDDLLSLLAEGDSMTLEPIAMTEDEYEKLKEFEGY